MQAALVDDQDDEEKRAATDDPDAEGTASCSACFRKRALIPFIDEKVSGRIATGAEHELRAAVFGDAPTGLGSFPLELLAPQGELEQRARWAVRRAHGAPCRRGNERCGRCCHPGIASGRPAASVHPQRRGPARRSHAERSRGAATGYPVMLTGAAAALATDGTAKSTRAPPRSRVSSWNRSGPARPTCSTSATRSACVAMRTCSGATW